MLGLVEQNDCSALKAAYKQASRSDWIYSLPVVRELYLRAAELGHLDILEMVEGLPQEMTSVPHITGSMRSGIKQDAFLTGLGSCNHVTIKYFLNQMIEECHNR